MTPEMIHGILLLLGPLVLSLTFHEYAHARTALAFGDPTARDLGRCSLNPLVHVHPIGMLMVILAGFGWAKPVPVNPANLMPRRMGNIAVSLAGPLANLALAAICAGVLRAMAAGGVVVDPAAPVTTSDLVAFILTVTALVNLNLMVFNLLPLFPLDGHHIARELLPERTRMNFMRMQVQYGMMGLLVLLMGPRILSSMLGRPVFSPLRWYVDQALWPMMDALMGVESALLAFDAMTKCGHLLIW